jgi:protein-S-isoprenylcysteine O-methyltransferase Ste14/phage FluMu protein Com
VTTKIRLNCNNCNRSISVGPDEAGKKLRCPDCQTVLTIPQPPADGGEKPTRRRKSAPAEVSENAPAVSTPASSAGPSPRPARAPQRKRSEAADPDDIWAQPLSSYSSPAIEEHEFEEFGIQRRQPKVRHAEESSSEVSLKGPIIICVVGLLIGLVSIGLAFAVPQFGLYLSYAAIGIGVLLSAWGHWQIRALAFSESSLTGFLYLWFFPYSMYFIFSRFSETKKAFFAQLLGNVVAIAGVIGMVLSDIQLEKAVGTSNVQHDVLNRIVVLANL